MRELNGVASGLEKNGMIVAKKKTDTGNGNGNGEYFYFLLLSD